ncbi:MAG TPA: OB-fold nucleic acid binding domain-containing protein [Flavipsychrobacter sp.]|nr:OB-fold nucleic acid binding domain-containing protein [Flavipsychrobacter sp.]
MTTKKGSKFGKFMLNDYSGNHEVVFWQEDYVKYSQFIDNGQKLMIQGAYQQNEWRGNMEFKVQQVQLLENVRKALTKRVHIRIPLHKLDEEIVTYLLANVKANPGNTELSMHIADETTQETIKLKSSQAKFTLHDDLINFIQANEALQFSVDTV